MRVAYVLPSVGIPSGWRSLVVGLVGAMHRYVEPLLFCDARDERTVADLFPDIDRLTLPGLQSSWLRSPAGAARLTASRAALAMRKPPHVDLVHSLEAYPCGLVGRWIAVRARAPHLLTINGTYGVLPASSPLDRLAYTRVLRHAARICPISRGTAAAVQEVFGDRFDAGKMQPINLGSDLATRVADPGPGRRRKRPTVLSVGALKERKGFHTSLEVFARVKARVPDARYVLVGTLSDREYVARLRARVAELGIEDVEFAGELTGAELDLIYREASVFLLTPERVGYSFEGFGLVYLEAGAYRIPVVGTTSGGVPDAVISGRTGFLQPPDNVAGLAEHVVQLLTDPELNESMGAANRAHAAAMSWERCAAEYARTYAEL